jgi:tetratricopeptide (TPR) repeat protein
MSAPTPPKIFISYSHKDKKWLDLLLTHLKPSVRAADIDCWEDTRLRPGDDWLAEIRRALQAAYGIETVQASLLLNKTGWYLDDRAQYVAAEPIYKHALEIDEKLHGPVHQVVAAALNNLVTVYQHQGDYAEAEPLYKRALAIYEKALGPEHSETATAGRSMKSATGCDAPA